MLNCVRVNFITEGKYILKTFLRNVNWDDVTVY